MKKSLCLLMAVVILLSFAACGKAKNVTLISTETNDLLIQEDLTGKNLNSYL